VNAVVARLTLRQLLGRRRVLLLVLLGALLVLVALVYFLTDAGHGDPVRMQRFTSILLESFGLAVLMPLVALLIGTAALGAEIEDGTAVYLLAKPIPRWTIVITKLVVATVAAVLLTSVPVLVAGLVASQGLGDGLVPAFTIAAAIGSLIYCAIFLAFSLLTGRALIFGLIYVLVWEGLLAGLFAGTRVLSVRQQTLAFADALSDVPQTVLHAQLDLTTAIVIGAVLLIGATAIAIRRLQHFEVAGETG
jgi:ABC-2 type transport system permease protein